jgi:hypothetical protein
LSGIKLAQLKFAGKIFILPEESIIYELIAGVKQKPI